MAELALGWTDSQSARRLPTCPTGQQSGNQSRDFPCGARASRRVSTRHARVRTPPIAAAAIESEGAKIGLLVEDKARLLFESLFVAPDLAGGEQAIAARNDDAHASGAERFAHQG